jgi:hypothetical protein
MPISVKKTKGVEYLYFNSYDYDKGRKKEVYCGPKNNPESRRKATELEARHLGNKITELTNQLKECVMDLRKIS